MARPGLSEVYRLHHRFRGKSRPRRLHLHEHRGVERRGADRRRALHDAGVGDRDSPFPSLLADPHLSVY